MELRTKTGNAYLDLGYPAVALREYEKVLETDPGYGAARTPTTRANASSA